MHISNVIVAFVNQVIVENDQFEVMDHIYLCNQVLALIGEEDFSPNEESVETSELTLLALLDILYSI